MMTVEQIATEIETLVHAEADAEGIAETYFHEITCDILNHLRKELVKKNLIA